MEIWRTRSLLLWMVGVFVLSPGFPGLHAESSSRYINYRYFFSLLVPAEWSTLADYEGTAVMFLDPETNSSINVVAEDVKVETLEQYVKMNLEHLARQPGYELLSSEEQKSGARKRVAAVLKYENNQTFAVMLVHYYVIDGRAFHLTGSPGKGDQTALKDTIEEAMNSFGTFDPEDIR